MGRPRRARAIVAIHSCGHKACVKPSHLEWNTQQENCGRQASSGALRRTESRRVADCCSKRVLCWLGAQPEPNCWAKSRHACKCSGVQVLNGLHLPFISLDRASTMPVVSLVAPQQAMEAVVHILAVRQARHVTEVQLACNAIGQAHSGPV